jgi:UDP-N-acetylmuramoyl-L-alanyl-D-glutamate--2,6-diaminopimelate ligase
MAKLPLAVLSLKILEEAGYKVGVASTAIFKVADREWLNDKKMTMLGRFQLQKLLKQMVSAGCSYAVIETSSQGIEQFRHLGIHYDVCVFTNLTPEHLEAHGGFENYKQAKLKLFKHLQNSASKTITNKKITQGDCGQQ